jgi:hypothetical protein
MFTSTLLIAALACQIDVGGPGSLGSPIDSGASGDLGNAWSTAVESAASTGQLMVVLDEAQLTSYIADRIEREQDPILRSPQVFLRDNTIQIYGLTEQGVFRASALLTVSPILNPDGTVEFELTQAEIGPILAPDTLKDAASTLITEALTGPVGTIATGIRVTSIEIEDGQMTIVGELR